MKPIKAYATYQGALDGERARERARRATKQGSFEASFVSFDQTKEGYYPLASSIRRFEEDSVKLHNAYMKAYMRVLRKLPHCLEVFNLILKNSNERRKSIWQMVHTAQAQRKSARTQKARSSGNQKPKRKTGKR